MPSSLQTLDTAFPKIDDHQTTEENFNQVVNYLYMLLENLRYTLGNLGEDNFNDAELDSIGKLITEPVWARIADDEGNIHTLNVTAQNLLSQVSDLDGNLSALQQTAETLSSRITTADGNISALTQTANSLSSKISDAEGNISSISQTVNGLSSKITTAEGNISSLQQTASSLSSKVSNVEGSVSTLSQTVNGFSLSVSNGTSSSTIKLMSGSTVISSKSISFSGMVTFSDLSKNGRTTINGSNITTGTINACNINGVNVTGCTIKGSRYYNSGGTTWMEVGKDLNGVDNDVYALYIANSVHSNTGIFGIYNGDSGFVTLNGKGFNFLLSDAIEKTVRINVGTGGKYWEFSTTGIKFCNANGTVTNRVQLAN